MDIEIQKDLIQQKELPQIRRITNLDDIPKVIPPRPILPPAEKTALPKVTKTRKSILIYFMLGLLALGVFGFELAIIYRYDKLNKKLYQISSALKDKVFNLQNKLQYANNIKDNLIYNRKGLLNKYLGLNSQFKILQYKMENYIENSRNISLSKTSKMDLMEGDLRVAYAQIEGVNAQNDVLKKTLSERDKYAGELTGKLIKKIGEQELLIKKNIRLKEKIGHMLKKLEIIKNSAKAQMPEDSNVN